MRGQAGDGEHAPALFHRPEDTDGDGLEDQEGGEGRRVTLVTDPTQDTFDRYGRLLAYVTTRAGVNLAARQLADGWAAVYVLTPAARRGTADGAATAGA